MWRPLLTAHIWQAPPHGNKNIGATHCDVPANIVHSFLFVDIAEIGTVFVLLSNQNEACIRGRLKPQTLTRPEP